MTAPRRLALLTLTALIGLGVTLVFGFQGIENSATYSVIAASLLCFGLYMAVYEIDKKEARKNWRVVFLAITVGVVCKYALIAACLLVMSRDWRYAVLAMAVAQIDPLSFAAMQDDKRMSSKTRTILGMWASFDDPVTALLTPLLLSLTLETLGVDKSSSERPSLIAWLPYIAGIVSIGLVLLWWMAIRRHPPSEIMRAGGSGAMILAAVFGRAYIVAAIAGWMFRPAWPSKKTGVLLLNGSLYGATFMLGIVLAGGVDVRGGLVLGTATYLSQVIAAWVVVKLSNFFGRHRGIHIPGRDTCHLALGQQNGITAIVLALSLESTLPGTVAIVSLAILWINILHATVNWLFDTRIEPYLFPTKST